MPVPGDARHPPDPPVTQLGQVSHGGLGRRLVVLPDRRQRPRGQRGSNDHARHVQLLQNRDAIVIKPHVHQEHAVHPALGPPLPVQRDLGLLVLGQRAHQHHLVGGQLGLDTGHELHEIRLDAQLLSGPVDDQPERPRAAI